VTRQLQLFALINEVCRKFFPQRPTRPALKYRERLRHTDVRRNLHDYVYMIFLDAHRAGPPANHLVRLKHQLFEADGYFALNQPRPEGVLTFDRIGSKINLLV